MRALIALSIILLASCATLQAAQVASTQAPITITEIITATPAPTQTPDVIVVTATTAPTGALPTTTPESIAQLDGVPPTSEQRQSTSSTTGDLGSSVVLPPATATAAETYLVNYDIQKFVTECLGGTPSNINADAQNIVDQLAEQGINNVSEDALIFTAESIALNYFSQPELCIADLNVARDAFIQQRGLQAYSQNLASISSSPTVSSLEEASPTPTSVATLALVYPQAGMGAIQGQLSYPGAASPAMRVYAIPVSGQGTVVSTLSIAGSQQYAINDVPPGQYYLLAYFSTSVGTVIEVAYTQASHCGVTEPLCIDHSLRPLTVSAGIVEAGIRIDDWNDASHNWPAEPAH